MRRLAAASAQQRASIVGVVQDGSGAVMPGVTTFTRPWTAQLPMTKTEERIFEYACHEGNYSLPDILRGARFQERTSERKQ